MKSTKLLSLILCAALIAALCAPMAYAQAAPIAVENEFQIAYELSKLAVANKNTVTVVMRRELDGYALLDFLSMVEPGQLSIEYSLRSGNNQWIYSIELKKALTNMDSKVDDAVKSVVGQYIKSDMTERERVKVLHDYLIKNCTYDLNADKHGVDPYTAYGALIGKLAVCSGYADAFLLLGRAAGLTVIRRNGTARNPGSPATLHMWNMVFLDGQWLHVDVTWDDPVPDDGVSVYSDYLLVDDTFMKKTHTMDSGAMDYLKYFQFESAYYAGLLNSQGKFNGTNNGYELNRGPTRAETAVLLTRFLEAEREALEMNYEYPFSDVPAWAAPHVGYLYHAGLTKGMSDTLYGSQKPVTLSQFLTFLYRSSGSEPRDPIDQAKKDGLIDNKLVNAINYRGFNRGDAVTLIFQFPDLKNS